MQRKKKGVTMCCSESLSPLETEARQVFLTTILDELADDPDLLVKLPEESRRQFLETLLSIVPSGVRLQVVSLNGNSLELKLSCTIPGCRPNLETKPLFEEV